MDPIVTVNSPERMFQWSEEDNFMIDDPEGKMAEGITYGYPCSQEEMCTSQSTEMTGYYIQKDNSTYPYIHNWIV